MSAMGKKSSSQRQKNEDREQLIAEYQMTEDEADAICEKLKEYED